MLLSQEKESVENLKDYLAEEGITYMQTLTGVKIKLDNLPGVNTEKLNLLHMVLATERNDCLEYLLDHYYSDKQGVAAQILQSDMFSSDPQHIFRTLVPTQKPGEYDLDDNAEMLTVQLRGYSDLEVDFSEEIEQQMKQSLQLRIRNVGLALIVLTKNQRALEMFLTEYPVLFFEMRSAEDILDAALICVVRNWPNGLTLLLENV